MYEVIHKSKQTVIRRKSDKTLISEKLRARLAIYHRLVQFEKSFHIRDADSQHEKK